VAVELIISHRVPAIILDGNANKPIIVWNVPSDVNLRFSEAKSEQKPFGFNQVWHTKFHREQIG